MRIRTLGAASLSVIGLGLVGCGGNHSNPELAIRAAEVHADSAAIDVAVSNPSGFELTLARIDYELTYGPLPVASGTWTGQQSLGAGESAGLRIDVAFDTPPIDPDAETVELTGVMHFDGSDRGNMAITSASFEASAPVENR